MKYTQLTAPKMPNGYIVKFQVYTEKFSAFCCFRTSTRFDIYV